MFSAGFFEKVCIGICEEDFVSFEKQISGFYAADACASTWDLLLVSLDLFLSGRMFPG